VINLDVQGGKADVDETSVTMLSQIISEKPTEVVIEAVRRANGSISLAAQEFLLEGE